MKEMNEQGVGATAFDLANNQNPQPHAPIYHTKMRVPTPTNAAAKIVDHAKVMRAVFDAK